MQLEDAVTCVRGKLVPQGYSPYPFRRNVPVESFRDKLQSIAATCIFRYQIEELKSKGVDFARYIYVPETDAVSGVERHDRADHSHVYKVFHIYMACFLVDLILWPADFARMIFCFLFCTIQTSLHHSLLCTEKTLIEPPIYSFNILF